MTYESEIESKIGPPNGSKPILLYEKNQKFIKGKLTKLGELTSLDWI